MYARRISSFDWKTIRVRQPTNRCAAFDIWCSLLPEEIRHATETLDLPHDLKATEIEYTYLQNPRREFRPERPKLPNQHYPGLGIGSEFITMLAQCAESHQRDIILNFPESFHNAWIYQNRARMLFFHPLAHAFMTALFTDLQSDIADTFSGVAWAAHEGRIFFGDTKLIWPLWEQVLPTSSKTKAFFKGQHADIVKEALKIVDRPKFRIEEKSE